MPSADVDDWTSHRDSRNRCTRQPDALYNLDKVEVRKWLTWVTVPFTGRLALARGKTQTCGGHRRNYWGLRPARNCRSLKNAEWVVTVECNESYRIAAGSLTYARLPAQHAYFLKASFTFSPACFKLPTTLSPLPSASSDWSSVALPAASLT